MKRRISVLLIAIMMITSMSVFASEGVPTLISVGEPTLYNTDLPFKVVQDGDTFTITIEENGSTGYMWSYKISDINHVTYISDTSKASATEMPGAPGEHSWTFEVKGNGVSTILFSLSRSWEKEAIEEIDVLVYKNNEKVFIEENQIISINDNLNGIENASSPLSTFKMIIDGESMIRVYPITTEAGVTLVPLRETAEALGYTVTWNGETSSIELSKGAKWTSIKIDENSYFKNRMAPWSLSSAPKLINDQTYVPIEFFADVLDMGIKIENKTISLDTKEFAKHAGYVVAVDYHEDGSMSITLGNEKGTEDFAKQVIVHTSSTTTISQKSFSVDDYITVISPMVMTMSLPGQTSAYVIY